MASISTDKKTGNRRILFVDPNGRRKAIRLGKMPLAAVKTINTKVEHLLAAKVSGCGWDGETARWVATLPDDLCAKLAAVGLIAGRGRTGLAEYVNDYITRHAATSKQSTVKNLRQAERYLLKFAKPGISLREFTQGDADDFRRWLSTQVGDNTARRLAARAKQFFQAAKRKQMILENPFSDMKGLAVQANKAREYFVTREIAAKVIDECPDNEWRLLFVLARYCGLRTPSEPLAITWADVDWERSRLRIRSAKTEHHQGHDVRYVPIFAEVMPYLEAAWNEAEPGCEFVITKRRDVNCNLRTQLERIIESAGLQPWPKLFQNLRSTCETELAEEFPIHVVCSWLGNSPRVAQKHYLQVTDEHFAKATRKQAQQELAPSEIEGNRIDETADFSQELSLVPLGASDQMPPSGLEPETR